MKRNEEKLTDIICPNCGTQGAVTRFLRDETEEVRGVPVQVTKVLRSCEACEVEFENTRDGDWRPAAYAQFRKAMGWVAPEEIIAWRKAFDLSQEDVGRLLGWGEVTLGRYERGALQTESHNAQLVQLMAEGGIARALAERPDALSDAKKAAVRARLEKEYGIPTASEIRDFRVHGGKTAGELGVLLFVSADTWMAWEAGATFPDARAGRLLRIMMRDPAVLEDVRNVSASGPAVAGRADRRFGATAEAKAFWDALGAYGFVKNRLRSLFPDWAEDAGRYANAHIDLGWFAREHLGVTVGVNGPGRAVFLGDTCLKATHHRDNPAHSAALAMSVAAARLVARATRTTWSAPLPSASDFRSEILGSTNAGWVDFSLLAAHLWNRGIPVVHLPNLPVKAKGMDGLVTRVEGRPVIVLNRDQPRSDWMLFVLAHECGHVGRGHLPEEDGTAFVDNDIAEESTESGSTADEEAEANEYAQALLVESGGLLGFNSRIPTAEQFADLAIRFGREHRVSPGHIVLNAARHTPKPPFSLMPLAMKTLGLIDRKLRNPTTRETCIALAETNLDLGRLPPESSAYLRSLGIVG